MPHYADGRRAYPGDLVFGKPYNTPREVVGEIVAITSQADTCNCTVAFAQEVHPDKISPGPWGGFVSFAYVDGRQEKKFWSVATDYGEVKAFQLLKSAAPAAELPGIAAEPVNHVAPEA